MANLRNWGNTLGRKLAAGTVWLLYGILVLLATMQAVVMPLMGSVGGVDMPTAVPPVDQRVLDGSKTTEGGKMLTDLGLKPTVVISNKKLVTFLADQQKNAGASSSGPYTIFSTGAANPAKPDASRKPDVVVDASSGSVTALYQDYANGRGATCFIATSMDALSGWWPFLQAHLWNKSLDDSYVVTHAELSQIPAGTTVNCFTQLS